LWGTLRNLIFPKSREISKILKNSHVFTKILTFSKVLMFSLSVPSTTRYCNCNGLFYCSIAFAKCEIGLNTLSYLYAANETNLSRLTSFLGFKLPIGTSDGPLSDRLFFIVIFVIAGLSCGGCGLYMHWGFLFIIYCIHKCKEGHERRKGEASDAKRNQDQVIINRRGQVKKHILGQCFRSSDFTQNEDLV
jgi:hypothetical protein